MRMWEKLVGKVSGGLKWGGVVRKSLTGIIFRRSRCEGRAKEPRVKRTRVCIRCMRCVHVVTRREGGGAQRTWYWFIRPLHVMMAQAEEMSLLWSESKVHPALNVEPGMPPTDWLMLMSLWNEPPGTPSVRVESSSEPMAASELLPLLRGDRVDQRRLSSSVALTWLREVGS
jgi:hypothetical protein